MAQMDDMIAELERMMAQTGERDDDYSRRFREHAGPLIEAYHGRTVLSAEELEAHQAGADSVLKELGAQVKGILDRVDGVFKEVKQTSPGQVVRELGALPDHVTWLGLDHYRAVARAAAWQQGGWPRWKRIVATRLAEIDLDKVANADIEYLHLAAMLVCLEDWEADGEDGESPDLTDEDVERQLDDGLAQLRAMRAMP